MKIYISGKISGLTKKEYRRNFEDAEYQIWEKFGIEAYKQAVNPLNIKRISKSNNWWYKMYGDIIELRKCTHIAMQSNWFESKGAVIEYFFAKWIFKQTVIFL